MRSMTGRQENRQWRAFENGRVRLLTSEGLSASVARKIVRAECRKRRALARYIGSRAARSGQLVLSFEDGADGPEGITFRYTIDDRAIRNDMDRAVLALIQRSGF